MPVRLTPKAARDAVDGLVADARGRIFMQCRVRAVPEKGRAGDALERLLAAHFDLPRAAIAIVAGRISRVKTVRLDGRPDRARRIANMIDAMS